MRGKWTERKYRIATNGNLKQKSKKYILLKKNCRWGIEKKLTDELNIQMNRVEV